MKKMIRRITISVLTLVFTLSFALPALGDDLWNNEYMRVIDSTEELSDYKIEDLDNTCIEFMKKYETDLVLCAVIPSDYEDSSLEELAETYMNDYNYGYGENKDCIIFMADMEEEKAKYVIFGNEDSSLTDSYLTYSEEKVWNYKEKYGVYGVLYAGAEFLSSYLDDETASGEAEESSGKAAPAVRENTEETEETAKTAESAETEEASEAEPEAAPETETGTANGNENTPSWYPKDVSAFVPFHNDSAPRVSDYAGIFSPEEIETMEALSADIRNSLDKDVVIYTDMSTYGLERKVCAADFYDFNGYGCGDNYEGICLFICMDPNDRGWWAACTGPKTMGLYTEEMANAIDDCLYPYMKNGNYGEGVIDWIKNIQGLYEKGNPFEPGWMPAKGEEPERFRDPSAPRISDEGGIFSDSEIAELEHAAREAADSYDVDLIIHTAPELAYLGMTREEYAKAFYRYNGYGLGSGYDGILLVGFAYTSDEGPNLHDFVLYTEGRGGEKLTEVNKERILGFASSDMHYEDNKCKGTLRWIKRVDHMEKTGRVSRSLAYWIWITVVGSLGGALTGGIALGGAKKKMKTPKISTNANLYMDNNNFILVGDDVFLNTTSTRKYSPVSTSSGSGSSSSGRSSYSSHYSGSSGRSHSGSGRSF